jgi:hypothetical protein
MEGFPEVFDRRCLSEAFGKRQHDGRIRIPTKSASAARDGSSGTGRGGSITLRGPLLAFNR